MKVIDLRIAIVGLGYIGLPLAVEFGRKHNVIGFDINKKRIEELNKGVDITSELNSKEIRQAKNLNFTFNINDIKKCNVFIITVPTPIDSQKRPDLKYLKKASEDVGSVLKKNDLVIYESTVFPGVTEEFCAPILEKKSNLKFNKDFYLGYSPERINPGDKKHRLKNIKKLTSGSTPKTTKLVDDLYKDIIVAGTFKVDNIKIAEAAKVIENIQRDVNIALVNEFSVIFNKLDIDTESVLEAASTKWNFLPFKPGLVGGHCIGVDPYYLTHKAREIGYDPKMILAGRRLNDSMAKYIVKQVLSLMNKKLINIPNANILIMGLTFKENCQDLRNTKVVDLVDEFKKLNFNVDVYDPWVNHEDAKKQYNIIPIDKPLTGKYDAILLAVAHNVFKGISLNQIKNFAKEKHVLYDIKYLLNANDVDGRL
mgnify:CR=1 FL=1